MKTQRPSPLFFAVIIIILLALLGSFSRAASPDAFTYQGFLSVDNEPATGSYDLRFTLFRVGSPTPGPISSNDSVRISAGLFTAILDFGIGIFDGTAYELSIAVRERGSGGPFVTLQPRQPLTSTPNASHARTVSSVPDTALGANVPRLNSSPIFTTPVSVTMLRVSDTSGAGLLKFGPTDDCTIGVSPNGPAGLTLRDPRGIRVLSPSVTSPTRLLFGPTDDCSIGIDPAFPGLVERDPTGFRLLGRNNQGCRLIFGPTMDCTVEVDPSGPRGLLLRDPAGIRILPPVVSGQLGRPLLLFGPTDDCNIGIDPLIPGLLLRDPRGVRIAPTGSNALTRLLFGPTDNCSLGIDPAFPGLIERDPVGFRLLGRNNQGCRLIFGPTMDCTVEVDPSGPKGLLLRDPNGIRILPPPDPAGGVALPRLLFGPTDDCSIGIDPAFPGLVERDPIGFRLLGRNNEGCRLIFGSTMNCTIEVQPPSISNSIPGLLLRDPRGIRILSPVPTANNTLLFGPTDDCSITAPGPNGGMRFSDPRGFTFASPVLVNGIVRAQGFEQLSSRRFKNDVKPIEQPLEKISKLKGVRFTWNEGSGGQKDIGFIAEEVAQVIPEVVSWEDDGENARGVKYDHIVAVAIEGIKAQQSQIAALEREKAELKESLRSMQAQLDHLSRKMDGLANR